MTKNHCCFETTVVLCVYIYMYDQRRLWYAEPRWVGSCLNTMWLYMIVQRFEENHQELHDSFVFVLHLMAKAKTMHLKEACAQLSTANKAWSTLLQKNSSFQPPVNCSSKKKEMERERERGGGGGREGEREITVFVTEREREWKRKRERERERKKEKEKEREISKESNWCHETLCSRPLQRAVDTAIASLALCGFSLQDTVCKARRHRHSGYHGSSVSIVGVKHSFSLYHIYIQCQKQCVVYHIRLTVWPLLHIPQCDDKSLVAAVFARMPSRQENRLHSLQHPSKDFFCCGGSFRKCSEQPFWKDRLILECRSLLNGDGRHSTQKKLNTREINNKKISEKLYRDILATSQAGAIFLLRCLCCVHCQPFCS